MDFVVVVCGVVAGELLVVVRTPFRLLKRGEMFLARPGLKSPRQREEFRNAFVLIPLLDWESVRCLVFWGWVEVERL